MLQNKDRIYPNQHPRLIDNDDINIISYKPKPLALTEDFFIPRDLYLYHPKEFKSPDNSKSLDIAIIGPTNSGKSSLLNKIIDTNISAVSSKSNTTANTIEGIWTDIDNRTQINILDTPGAFRASKHSLFASNILTKSWGVLNEVDKVVFTVDCVKRIDRVLKLTINRFFKLTSHYKTKKIAEKIKSESMDNMTIEDLIDYSNKIGEELKQEMINNSVFQTIPAILVLNKVDLATNKRKLKQTQDELEMLGKFDKTFHISCNTGFGISQLKEYLQQETVRRPWKHHPSFKTTLSEVMKLEDCLRQNIFKRTFNEVPYETMIDLKSWVPLSNGELSLVFKIEVRNKNHRAIIIGRDGINLREIVNNTKKDISEMLQRPVKLEVLINNRQISNIHKANNIQPLVF